MQDSARQIETGWMPLELVGFYHQSTWWQGPFGFRPTGTPVGADHEFGKAPNMLPYESNMAFTLSQAMPVTHEIRPASKSVRYLIRSR